MSAAVVALGAVGALARAELGWLIHRRTGSTRAGTWAVNLLGAALLGLLLGLSLSTSGPGVEGLRAPLGLGFLGGFTTFSTWMVDSLDPAAQARPRPRLGDLVANVGGMLALGVAAGALGVMLGGGTL